VAAARALGSASNEDVGSCSNSDIVDGTADEQLSHVAVYTSTFEIGCRKSNADA
jgi:hypothetical protein